MSDGRLVVRAALAVAIALAYGTSAASAGRVDPWLDVRQYGTFVCHADFDLDDHSRLLADLQQLRRELAEQLRLTPSADLVEIYLFRDRDRYRDYLHARFPGVSPRRALFVKGRGRGMVFAYRNRELDVDLRHEGTHAVLHSTMAGIPLWLDEGLAEYFEIPRTSRARGHGHLQAVSDAALSPTEIPHPVVLEQKQELAEMSLDDYRFAWAWVHFMLHGPPEAREELTRYLAELETDRDAEPLGRRLERRLPRLQERLIEHLRTWNE